VISLTGDSGSGKTTLGKVLLRAVLGGSRAVASGKSQVAVALEPPTLREFEPGHLVADPE
jgi:ABC-type glutathione transport system ATPase component